MDITNLTEWLKENKAEILPNPVNGGLVLVAPEKLSDDVIALLRAKIGVGVDIVFRQGVKFSSAQLVGDAFKACFNDGELKSIVDDRHVRFEITTSDDSRIGEFWALISDVLERDGYYKSWELRDWKHISGVHKALESNKPRENAITNNDLLDLKILLESSRDVSDFIKSL